MTTTKTVEHVVDYKTIVQTGGFFGRKSEELDRKKFEAKLDELGREGYELVWILMDQSLHREKDGNVFIFKRVLYT